MSVTSCGLSIFYARDSIGNIRLVSFSLFSLFLSRLFPPSSSNAVVGRLSILPMRISIERKGGNRWPIWWGFPAPPQWRKGRSVLSWYHLYVFSRYFECLLYPNGMWRHFLIDLPFIWPPYPRTLPGGAGWVAKTTHYDCCYYDCCMQERNPFGQRARLLRIETIKLTNYNNPTVHGMLAVCCFQRSVTGSDWIFSIANSSRQPPLIISCSWHFNDTTTVVIFNIHSRH